MVVNTEEWAYETLDTGLDIYIECDNCKRRFALNEFKFIRAYLKRHIFLHCPKCDSKNIKIQYGGGG